ncbi:hypothetical protein [Halomonas sp. CKK8]|uniref:hypothetical protein n=1 Tax=Halomonas sp. CKK8 TaxID=3036127 RepID=UPI002415832C|nr:hypothetical protein [Halomonas sp. CKK8]WFM71821.1 hypothetical protein P8934_02190 [Halomonas sp. CKK8]
MNIRQAMRDTNLFGQLFAGESWLAWRALLAGFYGLPLDAGEVEHWKTLTEREKAPTSAADELWLVVGRRGGKSQIAALLAVFEAAFHDYRDRLAPGEVATVMVLAADRKQARAVFRYVGGLLHSNAMLERLIVREDREAIELSNRTMIEVHTASFRAVRGYTVACCIADEIAYWRSDESANPDYEILNAIRPAMATLGGRLVALSSPYARRGELWDAYRQHYGEDGSILVAKAPSQVMNPTLPTRVIERAYERDAAVASAEYGAEFRRDLEAFVSREALEQCTAPGLLELPPVSMLPEGRAPAYVAFVDPSGGSRDSMTLAVAHEENGIAVLDCVREWRPPFNPDDVTREAAAVVKAYGLASVTGDAYGGEWPRERFSAHGIGYRVGSKPRSQLYLELLPRLNAGTCQLLDQSRLLAQLAALERRTSRAGRDTIDHPPRAHDDVANSAAGALVGLGVIAPLGDVVLVQSMVSREYEDAVGQPFYATFDDY